MPFQKASPFTVGEATKKTTFDITHGNTLFAARSIAVVGGTPYAGTGANTTRTELWAPTIPAGLMETDGDMLEFSATILTATAGQPHQVWTAISGTDYFASQDVSHGAAWLTMVGRITRTGATTGIFSQHFDQSSHLDTVHSQGGSITGVTWANAQTLEFDAQNGASSANGLALYQGTLKYVPAAG